MIIAFLIMELLGLDIQLKWPSFAPHVTELTLDAPWMKDPEEDFFNRGIVDSFPNLEKLTLLNISPDDPWLEIMKLPPSVTDISFSSLPSENG